MRPILKLSLILALGLAACAKAPGPAVAEAIKAGDLAKAEALLDKGLADEPGQKELLAMRFVLFRHLSVHGSADKQQVYLNKAIIDYDALASALGVKANYADMEASLRGNPEGAALVVAARKPIYGE